MPRPVDPEREAARARGEKRYISARLCPRGHNERFVASAGCYVCQTIRQGSTPKKPKQPKPHRVSAKQHAENIEAAKTRFNRPAFAHALADYSHTVESRQRSAYLDSLIKKVSQ